MRVGMYCSNGKLDVSQARERLHLVEFNSEPLKRGRVRMVSGASQGTEAEEKNDKTKDQRRAL